MEAQVAEMPDVARCAATIRSRFSTLRFNKVVKKFNPIQRAHIIRNGFPFLLNLPNHLMVPMALTQWIVDHIQYGCEGVFKHKSKEFIVYKDFVNANNFKILFDKSYPHKRYFNIFEFKLRNVQVPKHNFKYDSGVFVMQYISTYDGSAVPFFSNFDVEALRAKFSCLLVINRFNEHQVPIVKQFMANHAPYLLH